MKFLKYSLLILLIPFVFACGDDEDPVSQTYQNLLGVWDSKEIALSLSVDNQPITEYWIEELGLTEVEAEFLLELAGQSLAAEFTGTIEFKADNTYEAKFGADTETGSWELIKSDQFILLTTGGDVEEIEIVSVTSANLVVRFSDEGSSDLAGDGSGENVEAVIELTLEKN